ncbi:DUF134 domain-containing protein [Candidatus Woesearchaeota archaeon]|nr:DUF134 domain-containing protein [Candidatus Woesearchaeota archaeon]
MRRIRGCPDVDYFKPRGIPVSSINIMELKLEELEAVRLADYEGIGQVNASKKMGVSQPTFHRILDEARKKIAEALVTGKAIKIYGGTYKMPGRDGTGPRGQGPIAGRGMGRGQGYGGPSACRCPKCGEEIPHVRGNPCTSQKCPKCGSMMVRGDS